MMLTYHLAVRARRVVRGVLRAYITLRLRELANADAAIAAHFEGECAYARQLERDAIEQIQRNRETRQRLQADLRRLGGGGQ